MKEKNAIFIIDVLKNIISVYFDTFFVFYFFKVANYEVVPLVKYYFTLCFFIGIGFIVIRNAMKKNIKVPYFRIGIALQALYIALIMILKDNIIHYIIFIGFIKGIADGFYHFPKNILNTEKVSNQHRQKFNGFVTIVNKVISIIIPLILGVLLTYFSYVSLGKIFFLLFIVMFLVSFYIDDERHFINQKIDLKKFRILLKENKKVRNSLLIPFLSGLTYSSGVMGLIITLSKINYFKTNLNLGFVDSICAGLSLLICFIYTMKIKEKQFNKVLIISGFISFITLILFAFFPTKLNLIIYLIIRFSTILMISLISDVIITNLSNLKEIKNEFKAEYYLVRDVVFSISRCFGYLILFLICIFWSINSIHYLMIMCAISILLEAFILIRINNEKLNLETL